MSEGPRDEMDAACALMAAIAQIGLALRESVEPVQELGSLIANVSESVSALQSTPFGAGADGSSSAAAAHSLLDQLRSEVNRGIQQLQFYDRMDQHLSRLQEYLICVANQLGSEEGAGPAAGFWDALHAKLRGRLISEEQRSLFDLVLDSRPAVRVCARPTGQELSSPGSTELF